MEEESIAVAPSEENGNVPAEEQGTITPPSEQQGEETPQESEQEETPAATTPEPELFELPDGRKVDGATLSKEWKENFLPEFTKKSQTLAEIEKSKTINQTPEQKPYKDPNWQPGTWDEAISIAKKEALEEIEGKEKARAEQRQALENAVVAELTELKKADPTLNENALFLHANEYREKYGVAFPNLTAAYNHMKDQQKLTKAVQQTTAKNIAKRSDPVSVTPGASGVRPDPGAFGSAIEYLRSLKT